MEGRGVRLGLGLAAAHSVRAAMEMMSNAHVLSLQEVWVTVAMVCMWSSTSQP